MHTGTRWVVLSYLQRLQVGDLVNVSSIVNDAMVQYNYNSRAALEKQVLEILAYYSKTVPVYLQQTGKSIRGSCFKVLRGLPPP